MNWIGIERKWIELELNWKILNLIWIGIELNWKILNPAWIGIELNWKKWIDPSPGCQEPDIYRYYRYKQFDNRYGFSISIGNTICHDITFSTAMTMAEHKSNIKLTKHTPYLALTVSYGVSFVRILEEIDCTLYYGMSVMHVLEKNY